MYMVIYYKFMIDIYIYIFLFLDSLFCIYGLVKNGSKYRKKYQCNVIVIEI